MAAHFFESVQIAAAMFLLPLLTAPAHSQEASSYVSVFGGVSYAEDSDLRVELAGPTTILGTMHYLNGETGGVAVGRRWENGYAVEGELALSRDRFDYETLTGIGALAIDGGIKTYTLMYNGFHYFESDSALTPYVGAGAGIALMRVSALAAGDTARFRDEDIGFAYQAIAGVTYRIGRQTDLAFEYRHSGTSNASFTDDPSGSGSVTTKVDRSRNSVVLKLSYFF